MTVETSGKEQNRKDSVFLPGALAIGKVYLNSC